MKNPLISIITATYSRPEQIQRNIKSVLSQTYPNFEQIIVDDGAIYDVSKIINQFNDKRIKLIKHKKNFGYLQAKNTGLDSLKGDWFTILDDDDEMLSNALETLIKIPLNFDNSITAVSCNCVDASSGEFTGFGVDKDQYLDFETVITKLTGEHWGITSTSLLGNLRFNQKLKSDGSLWHKINYNAKRYYIHKELRIFHTEGKDRTSYVNSKMSLLEKYLISKELINEHFLLEIHKKYLPKNYIRMCFAGFIYSKIFRDRHAFKFYKEKLKEIRNKNYYFYLLPSLFNYVRKIIPKFFGG